jgi:indole-3-glycerol phosphate synthase
VTKAADTFLDRMVLSRRADIAAAFGALSAADRERLASCGRPVRDFGGALTATVGVAVIAEVKKASPSAGAIALEADASTQALHYQEGGAAAISVLTEPSMFGGSFGDLSDVCDAVDLPVLCKDFVVDEVQLYVARGHGADAILLMVSVLGERTAEFIDLASTLGLESLVEVIGASELEIAHHAGARLVGVNARDLRSLVLDREAALPVVGQAKALGMTVVMASGVTTRVDVEAAASAGADAVLVGETLMRAEYPKDVVAGLTGVNRRP